MNLEEEVHINDQSFPTYSKMKDGKICKMKKLIYGLKNTSRQRNGEFKGFLGKQGFVYEDDSMFTEQRDKEFMVILVHVDDIMVTRTSIQ